MLGCGLDIFIFLSFLGDFDTLSNLSTTDLRNHNPHFSKLKNINITLNIRPDFNQSSCFKIFFR